VARGEGGRLSTSTPTSAPPAPALEPRGDERSRDGEERDRSWIGTLGLLSGSLAWLLVFFAIPIVVVALYSVGALSLFPTDTAGLSFRPWRRFITGDSIYLGLFWKSIRMSLTVSVIVVILAYPIGYFLALIASKRKYVLLLLIIAPFLTSYLLRVLAWRVILGAEGVVNSFLFFTGVRQPDDPVSWLIYSQFTVILVLGYVWLPFVALPIFVTLENLERALLEAGNDLGASRWQVFWRVTFPLSLPGVGAAFVFVFIPTIGEFVTPSLVGGRSGLMYGNAISELFLQGLDWITGSVLALFLIVVVAALLAFTGRFLRPRNVGVV
jgi:spermidine/putrescine transport system permease protein